jgi:SAM-dependent methyltransferase
MLVLHATSHRLNALPPLQQAPETRHRFGATALLVISLDYVHGRGSAEHQRLLDQSHILEHLLHRDTVFAPGAHVLEVGCGVGAQTCIVARRNPEARFTCIDVSETSLQAAEAAARRMNLTNVRFEFGDAINYVPPAQAFDAALFCFVLEHVQKPEAVLEHVMTLLRSGGTLMAIEGDHGSTFFYPPSALAWRTIQCLIDLQAACGGDALIGPRLHALFSCLGVTDVHVEPRVVYADPSRPDWVEWFTERTYIAMVEGTRSQALAAGIADLRKSKQGSFSYTFFKAVGQVPAR